MDFTFGIVTSGTADDYLNTIIDSIEKQNIKNYEVLIVGNSSVQRNKTTVIPFDENQRPAWITRKKNIITKNAKYENIVYAHDYISFSDNWYEGFLKFGNDFDLCMTKMTTLDGLRFRDWCICPWENAGILNIVGPSFKCILPYDENRFKEHMYFSGSYWVSKKEVMLQFPLDENLVWGQGEDVYWSLQVSKKYEFSMNVESEVKLIKQKNVGFSLADQETIEKLNILLNKN